MINPQLVPAYRQPMETAITELDSDAAHGLTTEEAHRRLAQYGSNKLQVEAPPPAWHMFLAQFQNILILLLLVAAAISLAMWLYAGDELVPYEALVIFAIVLFNRAAAAERLADLCARRQQRALAA